MTSDCSIICVFPSIHQELPDFLSISSVFPLCYILFCGFVFWVLIFEDVMMLIASRLVDWLAD